MDKRVTKGLPGFGLPFLSGYLKPYRMTLFLMVVPGFLGGLLDIVLPFFPARAITDLIQPGRSEGLPLPGGSRPASGRGAEWTSSPARVDGSERGAAVER